MRKIIVGAFVSLDGVMQAPGGPEEDPIGGFRFGGWVAPFFDEKMGESVGETFAKPFDLLLGRKTYDIFASHWPRVENDPLADAFNTVTKFVATHRPESLEWRNSRPLGDDVAATLRDLKRQDGPDLLIQGSSELIQTLLANDLIDEIRLLIFPLVLGGGKKLFGGGAMPAAFRLVGSQASSTGVITVSA